MSKVYLINEDYIKKNSEIQTDILIKKVARSIWISQNTFVKDICGTALYNVVYNAYSGGTIANEYLTLLEDYIQPALLEFAMYKSIPFIAYALTNKGVSQKESDNETPLDLEQIKFLQNQYYESAMQLKDSCRDYLREQYCNQGKFPEYGNEYNTAIDAIKSDKSEGGGYCGIYLN